MKDLMSWFVVVATLAVTAGVAAAEEPTPPLPKELSAVYASFQSKETQERLLENLRGIEDWRNPRAQRRAIAYLVDLRNPEVSRWVLTYPRSREIAIGELGKREVSLEDAGYIVRAALALALPPEPRPGGEPEAAQAGCVMHLGELLCKCLRQPFSPPESYREPDVRRWTLSVIEKALRDGETANDENRRRRLELLRREVERVHAGGGVPSPRSAPSAAANPGAPAASNSPLPLAVVAALAGLLLGFAAAALIFRRRRRA